MLPKGGLNVSRNEDGGFPDQLAFGVKHRNRDGRLVNIHADISNGTFYLGVSFR